MRTAIISDLHLGAGSGGDLLRDEATRRVLLEEIAGADHVVLLGDVVELRELPLADSLALARPFFEELGAGLGECQVTIVAGNHDHRFAEPVLDDLSPVAGETALGLERTQGPSPGPGAEIDRWLGPARLQLAYPGLWLRDDVYATHGHYMDAHLSLPRAECLAAATLIRISGPLPKAAMPADYERVLRPIYGFGFGVAQARPPRAGRDQGPSETAWETLAGTNNGGGPRKRLTVAAIRAAFPAGVWALNRVLRAEFGSDVSAAEIFRAGVDAAAEMASRLGLDDVHVITGHTHRGGPTDEEASWPLAGGGHLHNTGSWVFSSVFHHPGTPPSPYWPGTVTWVEDTGPPHRVQLLLDRSHAEMTELVRRVQLSSDPSPK
jgi:UDP-2,3-diacylglucosamine pyrophosphatase LpxH